MYEREDLLCPITGELFEEPVVLEGDGFTYEKAAILKYIEENTKLYSPTTGALITETKIIPNNTLKNIVNKYRENIISNDNNGESLEIIEKLRSETQQLTHELEIELGLREETSLLLESAQEHFTHLQDNGISNQSMNDNISTIEDNITYSKEVKFSMSNTLIINLDKDCKQKQEANSLKRKSPKLTDSRATQKRAKKKEEKFYK